MLRGEATAAARANNVDAAFYEHLEQTLSRTLYDDIMRGRWGVVTVGDVFILISEKVRARHQRWLGSSAAF